MNEQDAPAPSRAEWEEAARRKRVIDLARSIYTRQREFAMTNSYSVANVFNAAIYFDAVAEKFRKEGKLS